ncbi:hypothetical protein Bmul_1167 [Burkholderia multivorans ATCC 17616]|nr:hypothetical protein Bmul_1167 [Burkholderia multivorans ATCC 17616]
MRELRQHHPVAALLKVAGLARSTFYYQLGTLNADDRHADLKAKIRTVFEHHKGRYGYRRVTAELCIVLSVNSVLPVACWAGSVGA